jgi:hypothetical protein
MTEEALNDLGKKICDLSMKMIKPMLEGASLERQSMIVQAMIRANFMAGFSGSIIMMDNGEDMDDVRNSECYRQAAEQYGPLLQVVKDKNQKAKRPMRSRKEIETVLKAFKVLIEGLEAEDGKDADHANTLSNAYKMTDVLLWADGLDSPFAEFAAKAIARMEQDNKVDDDDDQHLDSGDETKTTTC